MARSPLLGFPSAHVSLALACTAGTLLSVSCSAWIDTDPAHLLPQPGGQASCDTGCDDGIACTVDSCESLVCQNVPRSDMCGAKETCDATRGCVPIGSSCDASKPDCWTCDTPKVDSDGDGHYAKLASSMCGDDCSDGDPTTYFGAKEQCDGKDNDCNGTVDDGCTTTPVSCTAARQVMLTNGRATLMGNLGTTGANRFETGCGTGLGRGALYLVDVQQLADIVIDTTGSDFPTLVAAGRSCGGATGFDAGCAASIRNNENGSRLVIHRYDPAVWGRQLFVLVDTLADRRTGMFKLDLSVQPAAQYTCFGAPLDISKGGTLVGYMSASGSMAGSCAGPFASAAQPEAVVRYTATRATDLRCEAKSVGFAPALYAQSACGLPGPLAGELACEQAAGSGVDAIIDFKLDPNETTSIIVDNGRDGVRYELTCTEK